MRLPLVCSFFFCLALFAQSTLVKHVIAGPGDAGDGGLAPSSWLAYPEATASDGSGNLFISDAVCGCIRKVDPDGLITTIAGNGHTPPRDGIPAVEARLGSIYGLAFAADGGLYFSSTDHRVFSIDSAGLLRVVAGTGSPGFSGDGGPATRAELNLPGPIAFGPDSSLYIAERYNYRVRRVTPDGAISTAVGDGTSGRSGDGGAAIAAQVEVIYDVAVDRTGNLYVNDYCRIRQVTTDGMIRTIVGSTCGYAGDGGPAALARIEPDSGIALDAAGNLYIAEPSRRVRMVGADGGIDTILGDGAFGVPDDGVPASQAEFGYPYRISSDSNGNLYVSDLHNKRVFRLDTAGIVRCVAGSEDPTDGGPATDAHLNFPLLAIADAQSNVYIADSWAGRVRKIARDGNIATIAGKGNRGAFGDGEGGPGTAARIGQPAALALDAAGNLFIGDTQVDFRILKLSPSGNITTVAGTGVSGYSGDGGPATKAQIRGASSLAFDASGNLYVSDSPNHAIRRISPDGIITTFAGGRAGYSGDGGPVSQAQLNNPRGLFFDGRGNLLIADYGNHRIRSITPDGIITTIAGDGRPNLAGDGGPAIEASLSPTSVVADRAGNIYISDADNHRIRWIAPDGLIRSIANVGTSANISLAADGSILLVEGVWGMVSRLVP